MRRHHLNWLSLWILPLLLARALIPTGFMLSVEAGQLQLMFCPSGVVQLPGKSQGGEHAEHQAHAQHHQGMHHGGGSDQASSAHAAQDNAPCPFSLVASATPSQIAYHANVISAPSDERFQFLSAPTFRVGPIRTDRIRGPPSLA
ncbi:hypothetical protein [Steroidobacter sp.]|uniref:hypothetical protein n=1 Tax=Steroidobacter sp. TaxID=1978227 RepID=UPI001A59DA21|nr:hypothetical protein [Steroidobacter sp.]MBL8270661.1 hypothetical protein [Steroidobacter sp.]